MDQNPRIQTLFDELFELPPAQRELRLQQPDVPPEVRQRVRALLHAHAAAQDRFLAEPARRHDPVAGTTIGRYRLCERLGEGGFGVVWRAEQQEPVRREVALKIIKLGMDSARVVARFAQERQAMARMQHPHIAAVFDGGTTDAGRPYFVMELVPGTRITEFCRAQGLGVEERVRLLRDVCLAVQHAHLKGLVHRDLKPANILVGGTAAAPLPKIIDFGIAKAIGVDGEGDGTFTRDGQLVGTLEYMAPEQASTSHGDVDSRADVYSLGVLLYELLTGRRPFELRDTEARGLAGMLDRIQHEEARRPSTCVLAQQDLAALPGADGQRWARRLRGDLDLVVQKAIAKDPAQRYQTPAALAADLERFLDGRPVEAGPLSRTWRLRRFLVRHRLAMGAAALVVISLGAATVVSLLALAGARAETVRRDAALAAVRDLVLGADPWRTRRPDYRVREQLDAFSAQMTAHHGGDPRVAHELHQVVGQAYKGIGSLEAAILHLRRAHELGGTFLTAGDDAFATTALDLGWCLVQAGRFAEVDALLAQLRPASYSPAVAWRSALLAALNQGHRGEPMPALAAAEHLAVAAEQLPATANRDGLLASCIELQGYCKQELGRYDEALPLQQRVLAMRQERLGENDPLVGITWYNIAGIHSASERLEAAAEAGQRAQQILERTLGTEHRQYWDAVALLGDVARKRGDAATARGHYERARELRRTHAPDDKALLAGSEFDLAMLAMDTGDLDTAERLLREALAIDPGLVDNGMRYGALSQNLGSICLRKRDYAAAEHHNRIAVDLHTKHRGEGSDAATNAMQNLAMALTELGRHDEAIDLHRRTYELRTAHERGLTPRMRSLDGLAKAQTRKGDHVAAAASRLLAADLLAAEPGEEAGVAMHRQRAVRSWLAAGEPAQAEAVLSQTLPLVEERSAGKWPQGETKLLQARCRLALGDLAGAVALADPGWALVLGSGIPADRGRYALETLAMVQEAQSAHLQQTGDRDATTWRDAAARSRERLQQPWVEANR